MSTYYKCIKSGDTIPTAAESDKTLSLSGFSNNRTDILMATEHNDLIGDHTLYTCNPEFTFGSYTYNLDKWLHNLYYGLRSAEVKNDLYFYPISHWEQNSWAGKDEDDASQATVNNTLRVYNTLKGNGTMPVYYTGSTVAANILKSGFYVGYNGVSAGTSVTSAITVTTDGSYTNALMFNGSLPVSAFTKCTYITESVIKGDRPLIYGYTFSGCTGLKSIDLSSMGSSTSAIPAYFAYSATSLTSVTLNSNFKTINQRAFYSCKSLSNIDFSNITSIGDYAFRFCSGLTSLNLSTCTSIGTYSFAACGNITSVTLGNISTISSYTFSTCTKLKNLTISPTRNYTIGTRAFRGCTSLTSVSLSGCTSIGNYAFSGCTSLTSATINRACTRGTSVFPSTCTISYFD